MDIISILENALSKAVVDAFTTTLSLNPEKISEDKLPQHQETIISSIGITGSIDGNIIICLSEIDACKTVSKMLGMDIQPGSPDVNDGVGEITNMLAGGIKTNSSKENVSFNISIPSTVKGDHMKVYGQEGVDKIVQRYKAEDIHFVVIVTYKKHTEQNGPAEQSKTSSSAFNAVDLLNQLTNNTTQNKTAPNANNNNALDVLNQLNSLTANKPVEQNKTAPDSSKDNALAALTQLVTVTKQQANNANKEEAPKIDPLAMLNNAIKQAGSEAKETKPLNLTPAEKLELAMKKFKESHK